MKRTKEQILKLDEIGLTRALLAEQEEYASFNLEWVTLTTKMGAMSGREAGTALRLALQKEEMTA